ncbi:aminoacyl-tRNA hydrolase [Lewinellaceae bacterium SD302]|nr:aminoacyl-tRNA hydrolase [Lewinellaceae bacterium SD302]
MHFPTIQNELELRTARSGGAGGQHVNKVESKVELVWSPSESAGLSREEKRRLTHHLRKKIDGNGNLSVVEQGSRSQHKNRKVALSRMEKLIRKNLRPIPKKRRAGAFVANRKKRRKGKEIQSEKKKFRGKIDY